MPRLDGTGPFGQGPMTGRGMGRCARFPGRPANTPGQISNWTKEERLKFLKKDREDIEKEIKELESATK